MTRDIDLTPRSPLERFKRQVEANQMSKRGQLLGQRDVTQDRFNQTLQNFNQQFNKLQVKRDQDRQQDVINRILEARQAGLSEPVGIQNRPAINPVQPASSIGQVLGQTGLSGQQSLGSGSINIANLPSQAGQWIGPIQQTAQQYGVPPALFAALVWSESNFNPSAGSHAGARGLAQLMPGTAAGLGVDPDDPLQNLQGGARYLAQMIEMFNGNIPLALAAYNAGPYNDAVQAGRIPQNGETEVYVARVMERFNLLQGM